MQKCIYILTPPFPFQSSFSELTETLSSRFVCAWPLSHVRLFCDPWTVAHQAPLSPGLPRQNYWSGLPFLSPGIFLTQGLNLGLLHWQVDHLPPNYLGSPFLLYICVQMSVIAGVSCQLPRCLLLKAHLLCSCHNLILKVGRPEED